MNTSIFERYQRQIDVLTWKKEGHVHRLVETPTPKQHVYRTHVDVVMGKGFCGDHDRKSFYKGAYVPGREVSAMSVEVLRIFGVDPLIIGDNLITEGIDLAALREGDELAIGDVVLRRSYREHRPCSLFLSRTSAEAYTLCREYGKRGALFIVEQEGRISEGDKITVRQTTHA